MHDLFLFLETVMYYVLFPMQLFALCFYATLEGLSGLASRFNIPLLIAAIASCSASVWVKIASDPIADPNAVPLNMLLGLAGAALLIFSRGVVLSRYESDTSGSE